MSEASRSVDHRPKKRRGAISLVLALVILAALALPALAANRTVPEGEWTGTVTFVALHTPTGSRGAGSGVVEMESRGGGIVGFAQWSFAGVSGVNGDPLAAAVSASVFGDADAPMVLVDEIVLPSGMVVDNAGGPPLAMDIVAATCEQVVGIGSGIPPVEVEAHWIVTRLGSISDSSRFATETEEILIGIAEIEVAMEAGESIDSWDLFALTHRALALSGSLDRSVACAELRGEHRTIVAHVLARMLELVAADPGAFDSAWFADLVIAGLEAGAFGSGSGDPGAAELEASVIEALEALIEAAAAAGDLSELADLAVLAEQLGYRSLVDAAGAAIGGGS